MILYGYWRSSATWRVRLALHFKGLEFEIVPVHLLKDGGQQYESAHATKNPMQQVPVLELDDEGKTLTLCQSLAIIEYLEERFPEPRLLPEGRARRALARQYAEMINAGIQPLQNLHVLNELGRVAPGIDKKAWSSHFIERGLKALQSAAEHSAGRYLIGDQLSVADVCLLPQLYNARRFGLDLTAFPILLEAEANANQLEAVQKAHPDRQPDAET